MLDNHIILSHNPERLFECWECKFRYQTDGKLKIHQKSTHDLREEDKKCSVCSKQFETLGGLMKHKKVSRHGTYECKECKKISMDEESHQKHFLIHDLNRRIVCYICEHRFSNKSDLKRHMKIHTEAK